MKKIIVIFLIFIYCFFLQLFFFKVKQNTMVGSERKLLEKCNAADKIIQDTEKKLKNSIKMATEFKNKIENQKDEVLKL